MGKQARLIYKPNVPIKFTFNSQGQVIYKRKLDVEKFPDTLERGLEIKSVSKARIHTAKPGVKKLDEADGAQLDSQTSKPAFNEKSLASLVNLSVDKMGQLKQLQKLTMQTQIDSQERRQTITPTASQGNAALSA